MNIQYDVTVKKEAFYCNTLYSIHRLIEKIRLCQPTSGNPYSTNGIASVFVITLLKGKGLRILELFQIQLPYDKN